MDDSVLQVIDHHIEGKYHYIVLGYNTKPSFIHINKGGLDEGVLVPIDVLSHILKTSLNKHLN